MHYHCASNLAKKTSLQSGNKIDPTFNSRPHLSIDKGDLLKVSSFGSANTSCIKFINHTYLPVIILVEKAHLGRGFHPLIRQHHRCTQIVNLIMCPQCSYHGLEKSQDLENSKQNMKGIFTKLPDNSDTSIILISLLPQVQPFPKKWLI